MKLRSLWLRTKSEFRNQLRSKTFCHCTKLLQLKNLYFFVTNCKRRLSRHCRKLVTSNSRKVQIMNGTYPVFNYKNCNKMQVFEFCQLYSHSQTVKVYEGSTQNTYHLTVTYALRGKANVPNGYKYLYSLQSK